MPLPFFVSVFIRQIGGKEDKCLPVTVDTLSFDGFDACETGIGDCAEGFSGIYIG